MTTSTERILARTEATKTNCNTRANRDSKPLRRCWRKARRGWGGWSCKLVKNLKGQCKNPGQPTGWTAHGHLVPPVLSRRGFRVLWSRTSASSTSLYSKRMAVSACCSVPNACYHPCGITGEGTRHVEPSTLNPQNLFLRVRALEKQMEGHGLSITHDFLKAMVAETSWKGFCRTFLLRPTQ